MSVPTEFPAAMIAQVLGARLVGDGAVVVRTIAPLDEAGPDALSWVGNAKYLPKLATTRAGVVLVPIECAVPSGKTAIHVRDPDRALITLLAHIAPPLEKVAPGVDPAARVATTARVNGACIGPGVYVGDGAVVGAGTQLHAGVWIGRDATIGRDGVLWPNVVIREHSVLGDRVIVHANTTIGTDGFGYLQRDGRHVKIPQIGRVVIEDDVEIGSSVCIDRARSGVTRVSRGVKIDNLVQIGHNVVLGEDCVVVAQAGVSGSVTVGRRVTLAGQAGIRDHVTIGDGAVVAAQAGVTKNIDAGAEVVGSPAIDGVEFVRQISAGRRVAELKKQLRALAARVEQLEATTHD